MQTVIIFPAFGFGGPDNTGFKPNLRLSYEVLAKCLEEVEVFTDPQAFVPLKFLAPKLRITMCRNGGTIATATLVLFSDVANVLKERGENLENIEVLIVAAPQHQVRAFWCAKKAGFKNFHFSHFEIAATDENLYWCGRSEGNKHWCTWGPGWWKIYETLGWVAMNLFPKLYPKMAMGRTH